MKILVTGANGFVGSALCERLRQSSIDHVAVTRDMIGDISGASDWSARLAGCDAVVHLAARVHQMRDASRDPMTAYRRTNTEATLHLARQAAMAGVKRFIFVSTAKVQGEGKETPYRETDIPAPEDPYALSKWEAEEGLQTIARETGLEVVVLRPPLVYGPGVGANFRALMDKVARGIPLPLSAIRNARSFIYVGNLVDAVLLCLTHPQAVGKIFLVSDGEDCSTATLARTIANAMGRKRCNLLPVPVSCLTLAGALLGKRKAVSRLVGSFTVDSTAIRRTLGWNPPYRFKDGIANTVRTAR